MADKDHKILADVINELDELIRLFSGLSGPFLAKIEEMAGDDSISLQAIRQYRDALMKFQGRPSEKKLFAILPESEKKRSKGSKALCPNCSKEIELSTSIEPASQLGHVKIVSHYTCQACGYHDRDEVSLPKEIALEQKNLEELMKGV